MVYITKTEERVYYWKEKYSEGSDIIKNKIKINMDKNKLLIRTRGVEYFQIKTVNDVQSDQKDQMFRFSDRSDNSDGSDVRTDSSDIRLLY